MRDQSNSNRTVYSTHVKTALSRWQLENSWILSRSLLGAMGSLNSAAVRQEQQGRGCEAALPELRIQTVRGGKAFFSLGHSWAPAQLVRAASPLQHHVHRVKVCPLAAQDCFYTTLHTRLSRDSPQDSINRLNIAQKKKKKHTHTSPPQQS